MASGARTLRPPELPLSLRWPQTAFSGGSCWNRLVAPGGQVFSVMGLTIRRKKIVEIDILADPARLRQLDLTALDELRG